MQLAYEKGSTLPLHALCLQDLLSAVGKWLLKADLDLHLIGQVWGIVVALCATGALVLASHARICTCSACLACIQSQ